MRERHILPLFFISTARFSHRLPTETMANVSSAPAKKMGNKVRVIRLPEPCRHRVVRNQCSDSALCTSSLHSVTDPVRVHQSVRPPAADELEGSIRDPDVTRNSRGSKGPIGGA